MLLPDTLSLFIQGTRASLRSSKNPCDKLFLCSLPSVPYAHRPLNPPGGPLSILPAKILNQANPSFPARRIPDGMYILTRARARVCVCGARKRRAHQSESPALVHTTYSPDSERCSRLAKITVLLATRRESISKALASPSANQRANQRSEERRGAGRRKAFDVLSLVMCSRVEWTSVESSPVSFEGGSL